MTLIELSPEREQLRKQLRDIVDSIVACRSRAGHTLEEIAGSVASTWNIPHLEACRYASTRIEYTTESRRTAGLGLLTRIAPSRGDQTYEEYTQRLSDWLAAIAMPAAQQQTIATQLSTISPACILPKSSIQPYLLNP